MAGVVCGGHVGLTFISDALYQLCRLKSLGMIGFNKIGNVERKKS